ncbi:MAG TPA: mannonate dehydratase [Bauldia sp.]|nr:mannonate dehydratase [Bauldia sp.]
MEQTWRWYGPKDPIPLRHIVEAGATGIVTALHQIPGGTAWSDAAVAERKRMIEAAGLRWSVVESIPVPPALKARTAQWRSNIEAWKESVRALGRNGVTTVCYNFIPIIDWTRTDLAYPLRSGLALRFDLVDFVAYDAFALKRKGAEGDYDPRVVSEARTRFKTMSESRQAEIEKIVLAGLPGSDFAYDRAAFLKLLADFEGLSKDDLRANLTEFHREVIPVAEEFGVNICIHPDDPPVELFGLPRIVSTADDIAALLKAVDRPANGVTFCVGSLASRADNDVVAMLKQFLPRVHFLHLRNVTRDGIGSFTESEHLGGDADMVAIIGAVLTEEARRRKEGRRDAEIPFRPDHGHLLDADQVKNANPGYSYIGRLKGLAELRGVITAAGSARQ